MRPRMRVAVLAAVVTVAMAVPFVDLATAETLSITPVADTYANSSASTTNYGTSSSLATGSGAVSYLRYAVPATPADQVLTSATLTVRTSTLSSAGSPGVQAVREGSDAWTGSGPTWANRPPLGTKVLGSFTITTVDTARVVTLDPVAVTTLAGRTVTVSITSPSTDSRRRVSWSPSPSRFSPRRSTTVGYGQLPRRDCAEA